MTLSFFSDHTLYSYYFVLSCRHICNILYGFCVEYSVLLSLGRINISCFLFLFVFVQALSSMKGQGAAMVDLDLVIEMLKTICLVLVSIHVGPLL